MEALRQQGRTIAAVGRGALAGWLIVVQVSLSLVLLVAAGLFVRTFTSLAKRPLGFEPQPVLIVNIDAHRSTSDPSPRMAIYEHARDAVHDRSVPLPFYHRPGGGDRYLFFPRLRKPHHRADAFAFVHEIERAVDFPSP